ncbi:hypothetical protein [Confluentibacter sediminis]|uniref:hypothetical protein n=1 Tax=Confluentibacter sediminis TaxID=2219045 RepID=UPI0013A69646|nr:hypothetical protein [Confluentibacter sediminis]
MKKTSTLIFLSILMLNCSSSDTLETKNEIIFGEISGLCGGDCRNLFLLTNTNIYEDSNTDTFGEFIELSDWENTTFEKKPLPNEKFELAKVLLEIPEGLFKLENTVLDQQIYADVDFFIHIKKGNKTQTLVFDKPHDKADNTSKLYLEKLIEISLQLRD